MDAFESESKGVRALGHLVEGDRFVVIAGSYAVIEEQVQSSLRAKPGRLILRAKLIRTGRLVPDKGAYRFAEDVEFNSPSEAASIIWGCNLNGRKVFGIDGTPPETHVLYFQIDSDKAIEGYRKDEMLSVTSRNRMLVARRKELDKYTYQSCSFFLKVGNKYIIDCHHLDPLALGVRETTLEDLVSLCPTCHRIAHMREPIYSIGELKYIRSSNN